MTAGIRSPLRRIAYYERKRGFGPWGWLLLIFGLLVFFSNGGFFADGTNIISPAVAERLNVDQASS